MAKRLASFLRGMGSVLEIAPAPGAHEIKPLYQPAGSPEDTIRAAWRKVGEHLFDAMESERERQEMRKVS